MKQNEERVSSLLTPKAGDPLPRRETTNEALSLADSMAPCRQAPLANHSCGFYSFLLGQKHLTQSLLFLLANILQTVSSVHP